MFLETPRAFGVVPEAKWIRALDPVDKVDQLRAAQIHHVFSIQVRGLIESKGWNLQRFADAARVEYDRASRLMRGAIVLRLEDIAAAERVFNITFSDLLMTAEEWTAVTDSQTKRAYRIQNLLGPGQW